MDEQPINGVEHELKDEELEMEMRDAQRIAARLPAVAVIEEPEHDLAPFEQQSHTFLLESIDQLAQAWVDELKQLRDNTKTIEQLVLSAVGKTKHDLTELHLLGAQVLKEAQRGEEVCVDLTKKLDRLMAP
jgi:Mg2+ and Co2+ transporter CorA